MRGRIPMKNVTVSVMDHRDPLGAINMLAAHARVFEFGDIKLLNHFEGYPQFNYWENYEAWKYIRTDFAMFLHRDGYVLNPSLWEPAFLEYDFIGAPWPASWVRDGIISHQVGNDGFCIKSRRLMNRVAMLPWIPGQADIMLCCHYREQLESEGFTYAPIEVAARFSVEHEVAETPEKTFGFHGPAGKVRFPVWATERTSIA